MRQQQRRSFTIWGTLRVDDFHRRILWSRAAQLINPIASGGHIRYPNLELHPWGYTLADCRFPAIALVRRIGASAPAENVRFGGGERKSARSSC